MSLYFSIYNVYSSCEKINFTDTIKINTYSIFQQLTFNIKIKYISSLNYIFKNNYWGRAEDDAWAYSIKAAQNVYINIPANVNASVFYTISASSFDDTIKFYLNNTLKNDIHSPYACGDPTGGWCDISNYNYSNQFNLLNGNNVLRIEVINSGGSFWMQNLTVSYKYEWITQ